ncbi:DUF3135 domain-containing protein [Sedimenticola sp.]|uniref:DUF3135 domain-containing protein n=1 Tax=Sedimenticola sp. TaxID=1940285 RepID=UPI0025847A99|nr:DUF3135 domain-containing protein [Sedimenticola sp.]MCW8902634.1 DUF3135 domain-containing protein [Sedimenticola sp.]
MYTSFDGFDFDEWVTLAKGDPEAFEKRRAKWLETAIQRAPDHNKDRLLGLQFQIDMIRQKNRHPLGACMKLSSMMLENWLGELPSAVDAIEAKNESPAKAEVVDLSHFMHSKNKQTGRRGGGES